MPRYQYWATQPDLPPTESRRPHMRNTPLMSSEEITDWLDSMDERGWEFVSYGQKVWANGNPQEWWVFRRLREI